jgi:acetolactate synthase I/II/III large subunit
MWQTEHDMAKVASGKAKAATKIAAGDNAPVRMTAAAAVTETLLRNGIDTVYGLPGLHNDHLFDAFHPQQKAGRLSVVHTRHEQTAAYMALGAALATGKPQAFAVVPGPGFLNASAALLQAYAMNAPVLGLVGQIPQSDIDRGFGHLHELRDQLGIAGHMAKFTARIRSPHEAPAITSRAIADMQSGVPRPAVIECAMDVWGRSGPVQLEPAVTPARPPLDEDAVTAAAKLLGGAQRPLIVVGGGAQGASAEVTALAEMLEAPVAAFRRGHGVLSARHRLHVNFPVSHRLWKTADVVLAIGTRLHFQQTIWGLDKDVRIVRIDIDPETPERFAKPAVALVGDAQAYARALLDALPAHKRKRPSRESEFAGHRTWLAERLSRFEPQMGYLQAMRRALPDDGIFVDEVTQLGFAARLAFPVYQPRTYLSAGHQDSLGWGLGVALGAKRALPDRAVLAIAGDGGIMYQIGDLATAVQHGIAVVVVVFDNAMYGNVRLIQDEFYGGRAIASDLKNPDFADLARSFGMAAQRVTTPADLESGLRAAFDANRPTLIHVPVGRMPSPWDMILMPPVRGRTAG